MFEADPLFIDNMSLEYITNELRFNKDGYYENNTKDVIYRLEDVLRPYGEQGMHIWMNSKEVPRDILVKCLESLMK